jgi:hypothetical protein
LEESTGDESSPPKEYNEPTQCDQSQDYPDESFSVHDKDLPGYQSLNVCVDIPEDPRVDDVPD